MNQFRACLTVSSYTLKELLKSKLLYYVFLLSIFLAIITYVASEFTFATPGRVALDVGIGLISLVSNGIAIFLGVSLIAKEIDQRTIYMILTRPISRPSFLVGRILGMLFFLILVHLILGISTLCIYFYFDGQFSILINWVFLFNYFESIILLLVVILFSLIANSTISVVNTFIILVSGHVLSDTKILTFVQYNSSLKKFLDVMSYILPNFYKMNLKGFLLYDKQIEFSYNLNLTCYVIGYSVFLLALSSIIFSRKNLD
jgi:ABC-type transport system involved in multi-copper enzyme maturation permease subunit